MKKIVLLTAFVFYSSLIIFAQKPNADIDVLHYQFSIALNDDDNNIKGNALINFQLLKDAKTIVLDLVSKNNAGKGMVVSSVKENDQTLSFTHINDSLFITFINDAKKGDEKKIEIIYEGIPADGLIISTSKFNQRTFFGDNWPNRAHNWLPCVDHPSDKASVDFIVTAPDHYQVVSNGLQTEETNLPNHFKLTHYTETVPLATKVMVIGVADFAVNLSGNVYCIPVYSWVYPENKENGFYDYALADSILPFFIKNVGPYAYKKLANVQSKTRFGGMENASAIFYFENSIVGDRKVEALLTHEIAHQWFGNSATEKNWQHIWLSEGFATYMTHLYLENKYGIDTLIKRMKTDRDEVIEFSKKKNTPVVDTTITKNFMELLNANSYQKGGWILHMLRRKLGDEIFWKGIRKYYADYAGKNADTEDLMNEMQTVSGENLKQFFNQWLYTAGQPNLNVNWKFNNKSKEIIITIQQMQKNLFEFPLQINIATGNENNIQSLLIKDKMTIIKIAAKTKPAQLVIDPNINLLFEGKVNEIK